VVTVTVATTLYGLEVRGPLAVVVLVAVADAVLGVALGLLASAFARSEFQAVQFMPVVVLPQFFLCGLLVPREQMAGWLQAVSDVLPLTYAVEALQELGRSETATGRMWADVAVVRRRGRGGPGPGRGHPAEEEQLSPARRPTGRRPGNPDTREAVLAAARAAFAERGYDGASIRSIAAAAGGRPGARAPLLFGTKDALFLAAVQAPADPDEFLPEVLAAPPDQLGAAVVRTVLRVWDGPGRPAVLALVRSAVTHEWSARLVREFVLSRIIRRVVGSLEMPLEEREARGALVASQIAGLVVTRYVLRLEPLASAPAEEVVAAVAPTVQRYLTGEVALPGRHD
jgi:AcrR family transcriptional regulator